MQDVFNTAVAAHQAGRLADAADGYRLILASYPTHSDSLHLLGLAVFQLGQPGDGAELIRRAIELQPDVADYHNSLGEVHRLQGRFHEAIDLYQTALQLRPEYPEAENNWGGALQNAGQFAEAERHFRRALALNVNYPNAWSNLGVSLHEQKRFGEAIDAYRQSLRLLPGDPAASANLARALLEVGEIEESIAVSRQAIAAHPESAALHGYLLLPLHSSDRITPAEIFSEHVAWARQHADHLAPAIFRSAVRDPNRRLRIGYVSPDLRAHPVGFFIASILAHHDHLRFEVIAYSDVRNSDATTHQLLSHCDLWRDTAELSDDQLFAQIQADAVDVLVDLAGHTHANRLLAFARRAAPVQITYLGYPNSSALKTMDYWITDPHLDPPGQTESLCTEKLLRLPDVFTCYSPPPDAPPPGALPCLATGYPTFGCFNNLGKLTDSVVALWSQVLDRTPNSRLVLQFDSLADAPTRDRIAARFSRQGIDAARLDLRGDEPFSDYLQSFARMDIALDPFPFNGHTTTMHALWMGVPVVTLAGASHVSRRGVSLLTNAGLADLIATSPDDYVRIATALAADRPRLVQLRQSLRERLQASPLKDAKRFTAAFENLLRQAWIERCGEKSYS